MNMQLQKFMWTTRKVFAVALTLYCGYHLLLGGVMLASLVLIEADLIDGRILTLTTLGRSMDGNDESARGILYELAGRSFLLGLGRFVLLGRNNGESAQQHE